MEAEPVAGSAPRGPRREAARAPRRQLRMTPPKMALLRLLRARPMTVSEVSHHGTDKGGAHRHLSGLCQMGLVSRTKRGRKFVYYALTDEGRALLAVDERLDAGGGPARS